MWEKWTAISYRVHIAHNKITYEQYYTNNTLVLIEKWNIEKDKKSYFWCIYFETFLTNNELPFHFLLFTKTECAGMLQSKQLYN